MRIPIAVSLESRDGTVAKDAKVVNGILEKRGDSFVVRKRPGIDGLGQAGTGAGQLLYAWNAILMIVGDTLYHGSSLATLTSVAMSPTVAGLRFDAQEVASTAATQLLMVKNKTQAWTFDRSFAKSAVTLPANLGASTYGVLSLTRSGGTATASFTADPGFNAGDSVVVAGATPVAYNGTFTVTSITTGRAARDISVTITRSGTTATATSSVAHGLSNGSYVLSGASDSAYNGTKTITVTSTTQFTYTVTVTAEAPASPATGSPAISQWLDGTCASWTRTGTTLTILMGYGFSTVRLGESITLPAAGFGALAGTYTASNFQSNAPYYETYDLTVPNVGAFSGSAAYVQRTPLFSISGVTRAAGVATATVTMSGSQTFGTARTGASLHARPDVITIAGATQSGYNGQFTVDTATTTTWTYACNFTAESPVSPAAGSPVITNPAVTPTVSYTVAGSPATPATGTITMAGTGGMVPGIAYIDGYFVIMDTNGRMWHSALDDPTSWPALNFLVAQNENGGGKAIAKSLNYLIAFKEWSTEFFYDAKNTTGFAFSPVDNGFTQVGCASGESVANCDGNLLWLSQVRQKGRSVHLMSGLQQQKVSTPDIERILNADSLATVYGYGLKVDGHPLYVLTLVASNITLVYDLSTQAWTEWKTSEFTTSVSVTSITLSGTTATVTTALAHGLADGDPVTISGATPDAYNGLYQAQVLTTTTFTIKVTGTTVTPATGTIFMLPWIPGYFAYSRYADFAGQDILLHATEGTFWRVTTTDALDNNNWPIDFFVRTTRLDGGSSANKRMASATVVGDKIADTVMVRWSDDDCTTYVSYRPADLSLELPQIRRCGSFRRRTIEIRHIGNTIPRWEALELEIT